MTDDPVISVRTERPSLDAVKATAAQLVASTMQVTIEPRLGHVTVTGYGVIQEIRYDTTEVTTVSSHHLARATAEAIRKAEVEASQWREREFRRIGSFIR